MQTGFVSMEDTNKEQRKLFKKLTDINKGGKAIGKKYNELIDLRNAINKKNIRENENPDEVFNIVEKIFDFNKQQKGK